MAHSKRCLYCGNPIPFEELEVDHILPESIANSTKLKELRVEYALSPEFSVNGIQNLLPVHQRCNSMKSDQLFRPGSARFFMEQAEEKQAIVQKNLALLALRAQKEKLLSAIAVCLESGKITSDEIDCAISSSWTLKFPDETVPDVWQRSELRPDNVDALLDVPILPNGLKLFKSDQARTVRSCREYRSARLLGFYAMNTKWEAHLGRADALLHALEKARMPCHSYISNPHFGVADLHLLPKSLLPYMCLDAEEEINAMQESTLEELARSRRIHIVGVSSRSLQFEWEGSGLVLTEMLRADLDDDGLEELLVESYQYAVEGRFGAGTVGLLRRAGPDALFDFCREYR